MRGKVKEKYLSLFLLKANYRYMRFPRQPKIFRHDDGNPLTLWNLITLFQCISKGDGAKDMGQPNEPLRMQLPILRTHLNLGDYNVGTDL